MAPREPVPIVVVASLQTPLGGCIAGQRLCRATTATTATMQRSWDRQGQRPTGSAVVAIVASLHRCMQRCNDRSLHATMQRPGGQTMTTWPGSKTQPARPRTGIFYRAGQTPKTKGSDRLGRTPGSQTRFGNLIRETPFRGRLAHAGNRVSRRPVPKQSLGTSVSYPVFYRAKPLVPKLGLGTLSAKLRFAGACASISPPSRK
jgi:hypothetical protein